MRTFKTIVSLLLTIALTALAVPALAVNSVGTAKTTVETVDGGERLLHNGVTIDTNSAGGYTGDYVVIYNPSTSSSSSASTGSLSGLIETTVEANALNNRDDSAVIEDADRPYTVDIDSQFGYEDIDSLPDCATRASYPVGTTKNFTISSYSPGSSSLQFKVLYVGSHCRIWTVTNSSYHPLDGIDTSYAQTIAQMFDSKYTLMNSSYGDFRDSNNDGLVNLMFYNIDDGWEPGQGYVAGYFSSADFSYNSLPMIHIDTYPGIQWVTTAGETKVDVEGCYGTLVHEFQHCINYSETGGMDTWLNESFSGSAEELCFPGSGLFSRIQSWHNSYFSSVAEISSVAAEFAYTSTFDLHKGGSLMTWNNSNADIYARYAEVMLFSQYLYSYTGGTTVYKTIIDSVAGGTTALTAVRNALGVTAEQLWGGFFTAMVANDPYSTAGTYGFDMNAGYDPADCYNLETVYQILAPVIYTSTSAVSIYGGGFITVKPVNNVYNPPSGASSTLRYVGITLPAATDSYTVTFEDWDGTVLSTQTVVSGGSATAPADPTRTGYTFTGWSAGYTNITSDVTITAQYTINSYTVTFYGYNNVVLSTQTVDYGGSATAPTAPAVTGYTFTGWNGAYINITGNTSVYAVYTINTYTVTFYGYDNVVLSTQTVNYGGSATAPTAPAVTGYTFTGWNGAYTNITGNTSVYAVYTINTYTVTFYGYDNVVLSTQTVNYGGSATAPTAPAVTGYTFTGWNGAYTNVTADTSVYAVYEASGLLGDVNCDGVVNFSDVSALYMFLANLSELSAQGVVNAEINGDGMVNFSDVAALYKLLTSVPAV